MKITWKGKFDGNAESLPHGEHKPNAVKFKEIDDIKKLGLVLKFAFRAAYDRDVCHCAAPRRL